MRNFLFVIFCFIICVGAHAQYTSVNGHFKVDQIRGCAGLKVNITDVSGACAGNCLMSSLGTSCPPTAPCPNDFQLIYNTPGTYVLSVDYPGSGPDNITITVDPDIAPAFDIYSCAGSKVEVNITDKTYDTYYIDFNNDGTTDKTIPSSNTQTAAHAYGAAGNYNIKINGQKLNAANNCSATTQPFTAIASLPAPSITSLTANDADATTLQLDFTPQPNIEYHSEIAYNNSTNFQLNQVLYGVSSMTGTNLAVDDNYYCFRLGSFDPCASTNVYSSTICSHEFKLTLASGDDQLSWQTYSAGVSNIKINRDNATLATKAATVTSYNDTAITCKTNYCYRLVSNYASGATSTSRQKCGTAFRTRTPTFINNTSAVVDGTQVDLSWLTNPTYTIPNYDVFRKPIGGNYGLQGNTTTKQFTDATYNESGLCYQINYQDNCDNVSAKGLSSCPMRLSGTLNQTNEITLQWSAYKGWNQGVKNYVVQRYFQSGQSPQTVYTGTDSTYTENQPDLVNQIVYYKIIANAVEAGVPVSSSNEIRIERNVNLYYPTAFNPESKSNLNRTFNVKGFYIAKIELQIFDRWGAIVFYSDKDEAWDGRRDGTQMPDATYVWSAQVTDHAGNTFKKAGTIVLIRK